MVIGKATLLPLLYEVIKRQRSLSHKRRFWSYRKESEKVLKMMKAASLVWVGAAEKFGSPKWHQKVKMIQNNSIGSECFS